MSGAKQRKIDSVRLVLLYGEPHNFFTISEAVQYLKKSPATADNTKKRLFKVEATVRYTDFVRLTGEFPDKKSALEWLLNRNNGLL